MKFDPQFNRRQLESYGIQVFRDISHPAAAQGEYLGNSAVLMLETATECFLVGLFEEARELLEKADAFLTASLECNETRHPGRGIVLEKIAFANWLLNGVEDLQSLRASVAWREKWYQTKNIVDRGEVQLALVPYLEAEQFDTLMARYESVGLTKPKSLRHIKGEGTMCYVLARHRLGLDYTDDEISQALQTFLKRCMEDWLFGHYCTVARWMKIAHWKPGDDPIATVLRCYDYLPGRKPPKYPPG